MSNFEAINIFWNDQTKISESILDVRYEDLVKEKDYHQREIYKFLDLKSAFDEEKRQSFFSQTASIRQIGSPVHKKSIEKKEFIDHKNEFYEAFKMQRKYWEKRGILPKNYEFFGYTLG